MSEDWQPDWIDSGPGFVDVPDDAKDEFHQRVLDHLRDAHGWGHSSRTLNPTPDRPVRVTELIPNTERGPHTCRLWLANAEGGLIAWIVGSGGVDHDGIETWREAIKVARSQLGSRSAQMWRAFIAQRPASVDFMRFGLVEPVQLGGITVEQVGTIGSEVLAHVGGVMATEHVSALLRVDGTTECWAWTGDGEVSARRSLRTLVALVSLVWDTPWYLRDGPNDRVDARWHNAPGPVSGSLYRWSDDPEYRLAPVRIRLPAWFGEAARQARDNDRARDAVNRSLLMHHEGLLLARTHPSMALLSFVATIESLAPKPQKSDRCETCGMITGSTARFKGALVQVLEKEYEAVVLSDAYARRSRTVHNARLHGREHEFGGWGEMSLYRSDDAMEFEFGLLSLAQKASRAMLWAALELPGRPTDPLRDLRSTTHREIP